MSAKPIANTADQLGDKSNKINNFIQRRSYCPTLHCEEGRLAIELDGAQHLADAEAYRRDRRKDALLQENGYFVLRFLAEDIGKQLDHVLDTILRALAHVQKVQP